MHNADKEKAKAFPSGAPSSAPSIAQNARVCDISSSFYGVESKKNEIHCINSAHWRRRKRELKRYLIDKYFSEKDITGTGEVTGPSL